MHLPVRLPLAGVVLLAALLRLPTLGEQSLWSDEAATAAVLDVALGDLLAAVRDSESTPPLFYLLAWPVVDLLGGGETALRLVPALCSIATVPVLAAVGARLGGERAGLVTGLLAATSPLLVWFGQEARAYALLVLLCGLATLALLDRRPLAWGLAAAAALATHYFAVFLLVPQGVALLARTPGLRARAAAVLPPVAAGLALLPLAVDQRRADRASFIGELPLTERLASLAKQWLSGYDAPGEVVLTVLAGALVAAGIAALRGVDRRGLTAVVVAALALPLLAAAAGDDYVLTRNLLPAYAVALPLLGAGLARVPASAAAALGAVWVATVVGVWLEPRSQREDWRAALVSAPAPAGGARVLAIDPPSGRVAALHYLPAGVRTFGGNAARPVTAVDVVQMASGSAGGSRRLPPPLRRAPARGFVPAGTIDRGEGWRVVRWRATAARGIPVSPLQLADPYPRAAFLLQP